jgi:hypothetical protein
MTFGTNHYVPVLKVKRGEKRALALMSPALQPRVTPLLEIVERKDKEVDAHLTTAFKDLAESVRPYSRCFLDVREIEPDGPAAAEEVYGRAEALGIVFTPVTGISRTADVAAALQHNTHGVALRLTRAEFEAGSLGPNLLRFMDRHGLQPEQTDLIIDLGAVDDLITEGIQALSQAFLSAVPDHPRWRTFTLSACAFPFSMARVERHSHALVPRVEWLAWRDGLHTRRSEIVRLPTYSDCAIQHPRGVEGFDPRVMPMSAAIRYTASDEWLLIKGESVRITPAREQFPDLAMQLAYGHLRSRFSGVDHCHGCASTKAAADGASGLASAEVWRRLGTIHHLTTTVEALARLPSP